MKQLNRSMDETKEEIAQNRWHFSKHACACDSLSGASFYVIEENLLQTVQYVKLLFLWMKCIRVPSNRFQLKKRHWTILQGLKEYYNLNILSQEFSKWS